MSERIELFGVGIDAMTERDVLDAVDAAIAERAQLSLGMVNAAKLVNMQSDSELREDVASSDIVVADGMSVVWASRLLRQPLPSRVTGIDLMHSMLARGSEHAYRFFLFGATEQVVTKVREEVGRLYPGAEIAGIRNGYYSEAEEEGIAEMIKGSGADVLFVAMPSPRKERFMARWRDHIDVPVVHGVGGSFDVVAGKVRRAPRLMQKLGLEWLFRLLQEPLRLGWRYLRTNSIFLWMLLKALVGGRGGRSSRIAD